MKKLAYILFFIVIVIAILGVLGKIPLPPSNPTPQVPDANPHTGFGIVNRSDSSTAINFDVVAPGISYRTSHPENGPYKNTTTTSIRLIRDMTWMQQEMPAAGVLLSGNRSRYCW
jgi:hypothetical protein